MKNNTCTKTMKKTQTWQHDEIFCMYVSKNRVLLCAEDCTCVVAHVLDTFEEWCCLLLNVVRYQMKHATSTTTMNWAEDNKKMVHHSSTRWNIPAIVGDSVLIIMLYVLKPQVCIATGEWESATNMDGTVLQRLHGTQFWKLATRHWKLQHNPPLAFWIKTLLQLCKSEECEWLQKYEQCSWCSWGLLRVFNVVLDWTRKHECAVLTPTFTESG